MPFIGAYTSDQLARMRGNYSGTAYLLATPQRVMFQTQAENSFIGTGGGSQGYGSIAYTGTLQGAYTAVRAGQTLYIHTNAVNFNSYRLRTLVRTAASTTDLFVNESSQSYTIGNYITVMDDYDVFPLLSRFANDTLLLNYDVPFQGLLPVISGLQSVYATHTTGASVSLSFAPTVTILDADGATEASSLWQDGDGTITAVTSGSKDVTVS